MLGCNDVMRFAQGAVWVLSSFLLASVIGGAVAQPVQPAPSPDQRIEYKIDTLRLSVPLAYHPPRTWVDPPAGNRFRPYPDSLEFVLMWPDLSDASSPEHQRCVERLMMGACRDLVTIWVNMRSPQGDERRQIFKDSARPAKVGLAHGFEVSRRTAPIDPRSTERKGRVYLRIVGSDMGDPVKIEGICDGLWPSAAPETLAEIERQLLSCTFYYNLSDSVSITIHTFPQGFARWRDLYGRIEGLLQEWQRAAR